MKITAIVLSAGTGKRMGSSIPKQYMELNGHPVLYYSLKAFQDSRVDEIILVSGSEDIGYCRQEIVERYGITKVKDIVAGGKERYNSVLCGLRAATSPDYVMIHDGARPMLDEKIINDSIIAVQEYKACVVGMPVKDTIKIATEDGYAGNTPDRSKVWQIQTPQSFDYNMILEAYERAIAEDIPGITDDAMVAEWAKQRVKLIQGSYENIKITTPEDLDIASLFLKRKSMEKN